MENDVKIIGIIIFIFIILLILWVIWITVRDGSNELDLVTTKGFLDRCETGECGAGLTCDNGTCKKQIGGTCKTKSDCVSSAKSCTDGICSNCVTGTLGSPGPCMEGLIESDGICKIPEGSPCTLDFDCSTGICSGVCVNGLQMGEKCKPGQCIEGLECISGICSDEIDDEVVIEEEPQYEDCKIKRAVEIYNMYTDNKINNAVQKNGYIQCTLEDGSVNKYTITEVDDLCFLNIMEYQL